MRKGPAPQVAKDPAPAPAAGGRYFAYYATILVVLLLLGLAF